jgi:hypothetical protein
MMMVEQRVITDCRQKYQKMSKRSFQDQNAMHLHHCTPFRVQVQTTYCMQNFQLDYRGKAEISKTARDGSAGALCLAWHPHGV